MILVCYILAFIYFKMKVERIKGGKLVSVISWLVIIGFGCVHFIGIINANDLLGVLLVAEPYTPNIVLLIIEGIILLVINFLTIKNKFKAIILTLSQLGISVVVIAAVILLILGLFAGGGDKIKIPSGTDNKWKKQYSNSKGEYYTDGQGNFKDQYGNDVYNPQGVTDYDKL